mmetsp:Transcript_38984/g.63451  ORF Transcript_38984/g.63451 Transcript_38984/m.63451 type:complete len:175 (-) Transcript_38984:200-724(-)
MPFPDAERNKYPQIATISSDHQYLVCEFCTDRVIINNNNNDNKGGALQSKNRLSSGGAAAERKKIIARAASRRFSQHQHTHSAPTPSTLHTGDIATPRGNIVGSKGGFAGPHHLHQHHKVGSPNTPQQQTSRRGIHPYTEQTTPKIMHPRGRRLLHKVGGPMDSPRASVRKKAF